MLRLSLCVWLMAGLALTAAPAAQITGPWQDVIRNLRHPDPDKRLSAVQALGNAGYVPAAAEVAPLLTDPEDRVQEAAIEAELSFFAIGKIGGFRIFGIGAAKSDAQAAFETGPLLRSAAPAPAAVLDQLIAAMRDDNARVRFDAVHALGFIGEAPLPAEETRLLAAELDHYDPVIRAATARVLGRLDATGAAARLAVARLDSSEIVRRYAVEALGRLHDTRSAGTLRDQVAKSTGDMRDVTALALARIGRPEDASLFRQWAADGHAPLRRAGVEGLGRAGDADAVKLLAPLVQGDPDAAVRLAAAFALQRLGRTETQTIAASLGARDEAGQARDYLFEIGAPAVPGVMAVLGAATNSDDRADLIQVIGYIGARDDANRIEPFLRDPDEHVRRAATAAIARLGTPGRLTCASCRRRSTRGRRSTCSRTSSARCWCTRCAAVAPPASSSRPRPTSGRTTRPAMPRRGPHGATPRSTGRPAARMSTSTTASTTWSTP